MKKISSILLFPILLLPFWGIGQGAEGPPYGKASIEGIEGSGYYRCPIEPELQKYLQPGLQDLRIRDANEKELPYLVEEAEAPRIFEALRQLKIQQQRGKDGDGLILMLEDPAPDSIPGLALKVDQGNVSRKISIEGSQDGEEWEKLHEAERYHDEDLPSGNRGFILRDLQLSPHSFYRVDIGGEGEGFDPRIRGATVIQRSDAHEAYRSVPMEDLDIKKKGERTYIRLRFDAPSYRVHGLELDIGEEDFYYRSGFLAQGDTLQKGALESLHSFDLVSYGDQQIHLDGVFTRDLVLVIEDRDFPTLQIEGVKVYQRKRALLFRAKEGGDHGLRFGDKEAPPPGYDLKHFREQMPDELKKAQVSNITWKGPPLEEWFEEEEKVEKKGGEQSVWSVIGVLLIWVFGVSVFVAIGILWYRRIL